MIRRRDNTPIIAALLVAGILLITPASGMAVSGPSGSGSAGAAQYPRSATPPTLVAGAEEGDGEGAQGVRQEELAGGGQQLPFTGLAAVPLLLLGVGVAAAGFLLRSRSRRPAGLGDQR